MEQPRSITERYDDEVRAWAIRYMELGYAPTPLSPARSSKKGDNGKAPYYPNWDSVKLSDLTAWAPGVGNGLLLGPIGTSNSKIALVCADLDSELAVQYGDYFLPDTGMIGGRGRKPRSNRFYRISEINRLKHTEFKSETGKHAELLVSHHQIVVAPTVIIDNEGIREAKVWDIFEQPALIEWDKLVESERKLSIFCELKSIWPGKWRHNLSLPLAGGLLRAGWTREEIIFAIDLLGWETQQKDEIENAVNATANKLETGIESVSGWPTLSRELISGGAVKEQVEGSIRRILSWVKGEFDDRPAIEVRPGTLHTATDRAWKAIVNSNVPVELMRFGNDPIRIEKIDDRHAHRIVQLNQDRLRYHVAREVFWFKQNDKGRQPQDPPKEVIANMLAQGDIPLPILNRIVTAPVFSREGILQTESGYHPGSKTYYIGERSGVTIPEVYREPREGDVSLAKELIFGNLIVDFPYSTESDLAHATALLLLPFVRDMIPGPTPMHIIDANGQAAGKTLLASVLTYVFLGEYGGAPPSPFPTHEEEMTKLLLSLLMEGRPHIYFDNVTTRMASGVLAMALTSVTFSARILGSSETKQPPVRCAWLATSNGAHGDTDIIRRSVQTRLVSKEERPELRPPSDFRHYPLMRWAESHRGELIWACLTLISHWISRGMPRSEDSFGDFGEWSSVMGGLLREIGVRGFLGNVIDFQNMANEEREGWSELFERIWEAWGPEVWSTNEIVGLAVGSGIGITGSGLDDQKRQLGEFLRKKHESIHSGLRLINTGKDAARGKGRGYRLECIEGKERDWTPPLAQAPAQSHAESGRRVVLDIPLTGYS